MCATTTDISNKNAVYLPQLWESCRSGAEDWPRLQIVRKNKKRKRKSGQSLTDRDDVSITPKGHSNQQAHSCIFLHTYAPSFTQICRVKLVTRCRGKTRRAFVATRVTESCARSVPSAESARTQHLHENNRRIKSVHCFRVL